MKRDMGEFVTTIPACGYQLALLYDNGRKIADQYPVLSFMVFQSKVIGKNDYFFVVIPVTAEEVHDLDSQDYILIRPDGKIDLTGIGHWDTMEEFLKDKTK